MKRNWTRRAWLEKMGVGSIAFGATLGARADLSHDGDPDDGWFGPNIEKIKPSLIDGPSPTFANGKVLQPARELPIFHTADVVVVGGGPAGFAAAVAAGRAGAKVALVERYGSMGGLFSNGLVLAVIGTAEKRDGDYHLVTKGICEEFMNRAVNMDKWASTPLGNPSAGGKYQPVIDPEAAKVLMDQMALEAHVEIFYHCWGVDVIQAGQTVQGIVFESKEGRQAILAKQIIDTTGDGDLFFSAGATYTQITHALGFVYRIGNYDRTDRAKIPQGNYLNFGTVEPIPAARWLNCLGRKGNGLKVRDLTNAEITHRRDAWKYVSRMRATPGCEQTFLMHTASQLGVRATRLLEGEVTLTRKDALAARQWNDSIGMSGDDSYRRPAFQIPYRALLPKQIDNLLVAGRCISCTSDLIDRLRLIPVCMVTGQAAGTAAALAAKAGTTPRAVPVEELRKRLQSDGVRLA
ncbi:MAG: FAD-dependent oxidoreductase [Kiritimatiellia bacterium]|nr:FAD-dependent oxidoreductase [Kiritimatiellia bacterium]